jgi:diguanylate cyclase (GGDEF)-like protein/PAS domain S-box-containing protein
MIAPAICLRPTRNWRGNWRTANSPPRCSRTPARPSSLRTRPETFVEVNPAFTTMTGYTADDVLGRPVSILKSGRHPPEFYAAMWQGVKENNSWQGEVWNRRKDGEIFVVRLSITRVARIGQAVRYVATLTDITHSKELEEDLRHRAYHDPLTDLPNRALFTDRLRVAILQGERHGRGFALCFIDLDSFKPINDTLGHAAGDELLVETARRLRLGVRAADTVARLGGDEFAAILSEVGSRREVEEVAERIVADLARPFILQAGTAEHFLQHRHRLVSRAWAGQR